MTISRCIAAGLPLLVAAISTTRGADVIFDGFDAGGTFHTQDYIDGTLTSTGPPATNGLRSAAQFTVTCDDFRLSSITLPVSVQKSGTTQNLLRVRICSDSGGMPGATLEVLSQNQSIWPTFSAPFTNKTTLFSVTTPLLAQGSNFWIVLEPTALPGGSSATVDYRWSTSSNGAVSPVLQQQTFLALPTDPWTGTPTALPVAFRVEGTPVETPDLSIRFSQVQVCWDSCPNIIYQVQYTTNLNSPSWLNLGSPLQGNGSRTCVTDDVIEGTPQHYYRLVLP